MENFVRPDGTIVNIDEIFKIMIEWKKIKPDYNYNLLISTDADYHDGKNIFATILALHRGGKNGMPGNGALMFKRIINIKSHPRSLYERLIAETQYSIDILNILKEKGFLNLLEKSGLNDVCIHIDAGLKGKSSKVLDSCVGMVQGCGFNYNHKPHAPLTRIADKYTK